MGDHQRAGGHVQYQSGSHPWFDLNVGQYIQQEQGVQSPFRQFLFPHNFRKVVIPTNYTRFCLGDFQVFSALSWMVASPVAEI